MDEVKAMATAGESMGRAVGTGIRTVREGAQRAGRSGARASRDAARRAEDGLARRGLAPGQLAELIDENAKNARKGLDRRKKKLVKQRAKAQKQLRKAAKEARAELAKQNRPRRRRWPWVLAALVAAGAAAVAASKRQEEELFLAEADLSPELSEAESDRKRQGDPLANGVTDASRNGSGESANSDTGEHSRKR
ncbi:hypothetical protein [Actinoalloteichus caeruleus]|uniref:hypothetical protein n=1 Tax=Actinoalloteichus cyanogriseus TaxID=2893586 RepID=UPI00068BA982|nr:hypothetical protein [Actinoalloteichus caeruleus]